MEEEEERFRQDYEEHPSWFDYENVGYSAVTYFAEYYQLDSAYKYLYMYIDKWGEMDLNDLEQDCPQLQAYPERWNRLMGDYPWQKWKVYFYILSKLDYTGRKMEYYRPEIKHPDRISRQFNSEKWIATGRTWAGGLAQPLYHG